MVEAGAIVLITNWFLTAETQGQARRFMLQEQFGLLAKASGVYVCRRGLKDVILDSWLFLN
jgi:hypothetical protein